MRTFVSNAIRGLVVSIHRSPWLYLLGCLLVTSGLGLAARGIELRSKLEDLLPQSAPSVGAMQVLRERLGSADSLVVTLMSDDFGRVRPVLPKIAEALEKHPDIQRVEWHRDLSLLDKNALIVFPTRKDLEDYLEELTEAIKKAVAGRMKLFDDDEAEAGDAAKPAGPRRHYAWGELEDDDALSRLGRRFRNERARFREYYYNNDYTTIGLQVFPRRPSSDIKFSQRIIGEVEQLIAGTIEANLGPIGPDKVVKRVDLGGSYRSSVEETEGIRKDVASSSSLSLLALAALLAFAFRSGRALFCILVPLVMATVWTAGLVALTIGYLNIVTAFIFAVLLGLGIDFGIHYFGRYREERAAGKTPLDAMLETQIHCGEATLNAQLTTTVAFLTLALADFRGFSQFGLVAAMGVVLCHLAVVVVMPAVAFAYERVRPMKMRGFKVARDESGDIIRQRFPVGRLTAVGGVLACVGAFVIAPRSIEFEYDFRNLGPAPKEAKGYEKIQYGTTTATAPAVIFARSAEEAQQIHEQLRERLEKVDGHHERIKNYQSLYSLVPADQAERRDLVEKICRKLRRKVGLFEGDAREGAEELLSHCDPGPIEVKDLPPWITSQFADKNGTVGEFIYVSPRGSVNDGQVALGFREELITLKTPDGQPPVISGKPMVMAEVLLQMETDGKLITITSLLAVMLVILFFERSFKTLLVVLLPLMTAFGIVAAAMAVFDLKLNFFNMLAAPTLIGLGVDGGTHIYHRYRSLGDGSIPYVLRHTGMSTFLAAATASIGYASLVQADHRGLVSLGVLTLTCIAANLFTTFVLLPALMQWREDVRTKKGAKA